MHNYDDRTLKIMKEISLKEVPSKKKLTVVSLSAKPDSWMGKAWASQQGYPQQPWRDIAVY